MTTITGKFILCFYLGCICQLMSLTAYAGNGTPAGSGDVANQPVNVMVAGDTYSTLVYAGTASAGVIVSKDAGATWAAANTGLQGNLQVNALTIDSNQNIYAGTAAGGVYKSSNQGNSWMAVNNGLAASNGGKVQVTALLATPSPAELRSATTKMALYAGTDVDGLYSSSDGGANWIHLALTASHIKSLTIDANGNLYAGTLSLGIFKSTDGGASWVAASTGLPSLPGSTYAAINALSSDDKQGYVLAATDFGIFKNADGKNWKAANAGLTNIVGKVLMTDNSTLKTWLGTADGIFTSTDGGFSWFLEYATNKAPVTGLAKINQGLCIATANGVMLKIIYATGALPPNDIISGGGTGPIAALKLTAGFVIGPPYRGKTGHAYVVAVLADGSLYSLTSDGWVYSNATPIQPYTTIGLYDLRTQVLDGSVDLSAYKGTVFYTGYGLDVSDMLANKKYALIYQIPSTP